MSVQIQYLIDPASLINHINQVNHWRKGGSFSISPTPHTHDHGRVAWQLPELPYHYCSANSETLHLPFGLASLHRRYACLASLITGPVISSLHDTTSALTASSRRKQFTCNVPPVRWLCRLRPQPQLQLQLHVLYITSYKAVLLYNTLI